MVLHYAHPGSRHTSPNASLLRDKWGTTFLISNCNELPQIIEKMGWPTGLEPVTLGITTLKIPSKILNLNDSLNRKWRKTG
jgi:hypothetical protein